MVSAQARRRQVGLARKKGLSCRRACALVGVARSSLHYENRFEGKDKTLVEQLRALARRYPRYGYRRVWKLLQKEGERINRKRVHRLWRKLGLSLPRRRSKKKVRRVQVKPPAPTGINQVWAYDFVFDQCENGQQLKCLTVVDEYSRECLCIAVEGRLWSTKVIEILGRLFSEYGTPQYLKSDNGPEFVAEAVKEWLERQGVETRYSDPGSPWQNGKNESFNGKFREECLSLERFRDRREAKVVIEEWRQEYNERRPHSSLEYRTPAEVGARRRKTEHNELGALSC
jgi:putative transposase